MIERKIVAQKKKEFAIQEYVGSSLKGVGHSYTKMQRTPLGEKIIIFASRPGLIVGRKGANIKKLTKDLKVKFNLENPQIEISEVEDLNLDAQIVAENIAGSLERFGSSKFKGIGHKTMERVIGSGALGIEILISGKIPSQRARRWRFYQGYLKKCGEMALIGVKTAYTTAQLKTGIVGIQVRIMPPDIPLPDKIELLDEKKEIVEEIETETKENKEKTKKTKKVKKKKAKKETDTKAESEAPKEQKEESND